MTEQGTEGTTGARRWMFAAVLLCVQTAVAQHAKDYVGLYREQGEPDVVLSVAEQGRELTIEGVRTARSVMHPFGHDAYVSGPVHFNFTREGEAVHTLSVAGAGRTPTDPPVIYEKISDVPQVLNHFREYTRVDEMVPVRDGVKLHVVVLRPKGSENSGEPLPIFLTRTPYGTDMNSSDMVNATKPEMAQSGYIFVYGDIRGRYESEGQFVMNHPTVHAYGNRTDPKLVDESTDAYDTVDWLVKNLPNNNGRVGVWGVSYPGFTAMLAGIDHHPAVKAISPQAPMTDVWMGDDFFHSGAFRETYGFDYSQRMEKTKKDVPMSMPEDQFDFFLRYGNFEGAAKAVDGTELPSIHHFLMEPAYTKFWKDMAVQPLLTKVEVPTLEVGGWFDQEDMWGTQEEYRALHAHETKTGPQVMMVLGPWNHGGWAVTTRHLGAVDFGSATGDTYRRQFEFPFFEKYLKDRAGFDLQDTASFRTGENAWHRYETWPPVKGFHEAKLYLAPQHGLSFDKPRGASDLTHHQQYLADPADPVPYRPRPIQSTYGVGSTWRTWLATNQAPLKDRKDIATFMTPVLESDTTVTGDVMAHLFASTTGSDADWVVKLIDVYPDDALNGMAGYQLMIVDEIFRGRYWKSFEIPTAIEPNRISEYKWSLHGADHTFLKGHRMMVTVQSSWFPLYDRNPQTFVANIMTAPLEAYKPARQNIYFSAKHASYLEVLRPDGEK